jgi:hypothetical protein
MSPTLATRVAVTADALQVCHARAGTCALVALPGETGSCRNCQGLAGWPMCPGFRRAAACWRWQATLTSIATLLMPRLTQCIGANSNTHVVQAVTCAARLCHRARVNVVHKHRFIHHQAGGEQHAAVLQHSGMPACSL